MNYLIAQLIFAALTAACRHVSVAILQSTF